MSDLIIKKNGTDYKLPMLAEHYPADRVYLDGDTSKTVQDEIDNLKKYQYTRKVSNSFTSTDSIDFVAPADGYLCVFSTNPNTEVLVRLNGADGNNLIAKNGIIATSSSNWKFDTLYMRKNMTVTIIPSGGTNGGYQFFGF